MGLVYSDWARLVSMTAAIWSVWGSLWGIFFRKFFLDIIGGTIGKNGLIAPQSSAIFITLIVKAPILQIITILLGLGLLAIEWPLPFLSGTVFHRSIILKMVILFWLSFVSLLIYQAADSTLVSLGALAIYTKAQMKGEGSRTKASSAQEERV